MIARGTGVRLVCTAIAWIAATTGWAQTPVADVRLPAAASWPPVVVIVGAADGADALGDALRANGVASLALTLSERDLQAGERDAVLRRLLDSLRDLRNDTRFPTVSVIGRGSSTSIAAIAARISRVDGFISIEPKDASRDIEPLTVPKLETSEDEAGAKASAEFARTVPAFGRSGTRERRPVTPRASPRAYALGTVDGALIGIEYGQPQRRNREIWGRLVEWNRVWMPGADESTTMTCPVAVTIGDLTVPAGDHTFYTWPKDETLELIVNSEVGQFHIVYHPQQDLGRVPMRLTRRTDRVEGLTFVVEPKPAGGLLKLIWDDREYAVSISAKPGR